VRFRRLLVLVPVLALVAACAPNHGHPLEHNRGSWPLVVVEDHTPAGYPVNGAFGPGWGISGAIRGSCVTNATRVCYRFFVGTRTTTGHSVARGKSYTEYFWHNGGPHNGQVYRCETVFNFDFAHTSAAQHIQTVRHEIGHCYGLDDAPQGSGTMEPIVRGEHPNPTADERSTVKAMNTG
jgi:hypothetical protein